MGDVNDTFNIFSFFRPEDMTPEEEAYYHKIFEDDHGNPLPDDKATQNMKADLDSITGKDALEALKQIAESEEIAADAFRGRRDAVLGFFQTAPAENLHALLQTGGTASASGWYNEANKNFQKTGKEFDQTALYNALAIFIQEEAARALLPEVVKIKADFQEEHGREMTLADFLSRWKDPPGELSLDDLTNGMDRKHRLELTQKESFFDLLLKKLKNSPPPSVVNGKLFESDLMPMYSTKELMAMAQVKTPTNQKAGFIPSLLVTTPAEVEYYFNALGSGTFPNVGTSELQAFYAALVALARNNPKNIMPGQASPFGYIPLAEFGELTRSKKSREENPVYYTPRKMDTPEEQAAENRRVERRLVKLRASVRKSFENLKQAKVEFKDPKKKRGQGGPTVIIGNYKIEDIGGTEYIEVEFLKSAADAITATGLLTMFNSKLLGIDKRNHNAFSIGLKMLFQNNYDSNVQRGTDKILSVKTLLENAPELPKYEDLKKQGRRDWKPKIIDPLEENLDALKEVDFLEDWYYIDPKTKEKITRGTARELPYSVWENLRVYYEPVTEQEEARRKSRLDRKAKEKTAAAEKKTRQGKKPAKNIEKST